MCKNCFQFEKKWFSQFIKEIFSYLFRYSGEFEPYVRPDTQLGFIVDGQPVDEYGRPLGIYGHPPMGDYHLAYRNGNMEEDYAYGNYAYHR